MTTSPRNIGAIVGGQGFVDVGIGSDTIVYDPPLREIRVGTAPGNVTVVYPDDSSGTIKNMAVGEVRVGFFVQVMATGTSATGIEGTI